MIFNLPKAWLILCLPEDFESNDRTIFSKRINGVGISDVVFFIDKESGYVFSESIVKSINDGSIELMIVKSIDRHPALSFNAISARHLVNFNNFRGCELLSPETLLYFKTVFGDPDKYI